MRSTLTLCAAAVATTLWSSVNAISTVNRTGRYLYADNARFYIKGVAYQPQGMPPSLALQGTVVDSSSNTFEEPSTFTDPLANSSACSRDLPYLQALSINTIRVYSVNSSLNHDECMKTFSDAGIYTIIDLSLPSNGSIDRTSPAWSTNLLDQYIATIDVFDGYDNVLAFNVGNEVITSSGSDTGVAAFVKAAARDIKAYLTSKSSSVLVGYASIDGTANWRNPLANYLSCDASNTNSGSNAIDLYGLNNYEWCGNSTYDAAYKQTNEDYADYNVVAYFSEFGCLPSDGLPRPWTEVASLFSSNMTGVWSGGIAFSYFPATSADGQFGMVNISSNGATVTTGTDYNNLKKEYSAVSPTNSPPASSATATYPACPTQNSTFSASTSLPGTPNESACDCFEKTLACQFTPTTSNYSAISGALINYGCQLLGENGASCDDISGNGTTGEYGRLSGCDPLIKTSYVMSEWYEIESQNAEACAFAGNGTVNSAAASGVSAISAAETSCIPSPEAAFTPTSVGTTSSSGSTSGSGSSSGSSNGAVMGSAGPLPQTIFGIFVTVLFTIAGGIWTLV
ncbi:hypothetical protein FISHEDRAFT_41976 [Fistulina hepatica ATCC 64428]|uniref:1,3-beta-glucanosyltransferase n=1 Tax=Fistulina hepatica ATCC 64428 TaxID=1128425 RepID=A0A0D7AEI3_9AGAR|nr:hypothetical protein FISHEDRAFT_41976 [Fistulina hepatica ATCC 64428]